MNGFFALIKKEIYRFMSIWIQTVIGPLSTALLYQLIFGHQLSGIKTGIAAINYSTFLIPGLIIMQVLLNSFANSSSSIIQAKYTGNIIYILMAPITPLAIYGAYLVSSIIRGVIVGTVIYLGIIWFGDILIPKSIGFFIFFLVCGAAITAGLGLIAGILSDKFDQLAGFQSFIIIPLIYLAGVFFNPHNLNGIWQWIAMANPFMYIVDGFRYGVIAHSSYNIIFGALFVLIFAVAINFVGFMLLKRGIRVKH
ncbi:MAG: ABC transporter permease [Neisseriaceae bacterium]